MLKDASGTCFTPSPPTPLVTATPAAAVAPAIVTPPAAKPAPKAKVKVKKKAKKKVVKKKKKVVVKKQQTAKKMKPARASVHSLARCWLRRWGSALAGPAAASPQGATLVIPRLGLNTRLAPSLNAGPYAYYQDEDTLAIAGHLNHLRPSVLAAAAAPARRQDPGRRGAVRRPANGGRATVGDLDPPLPRPGALGLSPGWQRRVPLRRLRRAAAPVT